MKTLYQYGKDLNHSRVASFIPEVMNSLYNESSLNSTSLTEIRDAFRLKQIQGKTWLIENLEEFCQDKTKKILVIGSWFGFTSFCLWKLGYNNVTEVDPDFRLENFSRHLNRFNKNFNHISADVNSIDLNNYDIIINPSGEHIADNTWFNNIKLGTKVIIHSTDYPAIDHTNLCSNQEELLFKYVLDSTYLIGTLDLQTYKRFMIIGVK